MTRKKITGLALSLLAATIGVFAILKYSSAKNTPVAAPVAEPMITVLKVTKAIPKGTPASQLAAYVSAVPVRTVDAVPEAAKSLEELTALSNTVTNVDFMVGEQLSKQRLSAPEKLTSSDIVSGNGDAAAVGADNSDLTGVWINLPTLNALNGNIKPGVTHVAVFAAFEPIPGTSADPTGAYASNHILVNKAPVLDMFPPASAFVTPTTVAPAAGQPQVAQPVPVLPATVQVKLGLSLADAERVIYAQLKGTIFLGDEGLGVAETGTKIVERGNVFQDTPKTATATTKLAGTNLAPALVPTTVVPLVNASPVTAGASVGNGSITPSTLIGPPSTLAALAPAGSSSPITIKPTVASATPGLITKPAGVITPVTVGGAPAARVIVVGK